MEGIDSQTKRRIAACDDARVTQLTARGPTRAKHKTWVGPRRQQEAADLAMGHSMREVGHARHAHEICCAAIATAAVRARGMGDRIPIDRFWGSTVGGIASWGR